MFGNFDAVFHPEKKWKNKHLTVSSPCNKCNTYKQYEVYY